MNIFRIFFLIVSCLFSFSVFSLGGVDEGGSLDVILEDYTVFDLCFNQLLQRRVALQEEMVTVSREMENAEDKSVVFSNYSSRIFQLMLKVNVLRLIESEPIDVSENTCDEFVDKALSDFRTRMATINTLFMIVMADTVEMVRYKFMDAFEKQQELMIDEDVLRRLMQMQMMENNEDYVPNTGDGMLNQSYDAVNREGSI